MNGKRKQSWLRNLKIERVSLVDQGSNPDCHILLFKRRGQPMNDHDEMQDFSLADLARMARATAAFQNLEGV